MPLRRSPMLTPGSLAARRANALKSTGPRTPCGKARVSLNALKHGQGIRQTSGGPAGHPARFRQRLLKAGYPRQEALYRDLRSRLAQAFGARHPHWRREVDRFAIRAWCVATGRDFFRTKLECPFDSMPNGLRVLFEAAREGPSRSRRQRPGFARSLRYRAEDNYQRIGVAFWIQRRRYLTAARVRRIRAGLERFRFEDTDEGLESRVRCLVFRLRRPGYFERLRYGLDRNGDPDWSRQPWRSFYREKWEAARRRKGEEAGHDGVTSPDPAVEPSSLGWTPASAGVTALEEASSVVVIPSALAERGAQAGIHGSPTGSLSWEQGGLADLIHGRIRGTASRLIAGVSRWVSSRRER